MGRGPPPRSFSFNISLVLPSNRSYSFLRALLLDEDDEGVDACLHHQTSSFGSFNLPREDLCSTYRMPRDPMPPTMTSEVKPFLGPCPAHAYNSIPCFGFRRSAYRYKWNLWICGQNRFQSGSTVQTSSSQKRWKWKKWTFLVPRTHPIPSPRTEDPPP